ncbi:S1 family peptidase [Mycolicibacterium austroafricanum]|uniref:S1 family peptidase n=1 Tax=Mycolicibacterium austroafricanum TaxID=39687 RepID=UPI000559C757|nr:S1 family peptidase [Mycolicibacterium austroafricanum]QZY43939.1 S1 family peptidase [Mycolicibacterium austroafricanum]
MPDTHSSAATYLPRTFAALFAAAVTLIASSPPADSQPPPVDVIAPGYPVSSLDPSGNVISACTAGFTVHDSAGTPLMLTAGHCDEGGLLEIYFRGTGDFEPLGSFIRNGYESPPGEPFNATLPDIGLVGLSATAVPVAIALLNRMPITAVERPRVGQRLCKIGSYTGISCGTVTKVTSSKVHFGAFNRHGDSGGPVYRDNGDGTVTAIAVNSATPDDEADCQVDHTGAQDCGGTTIAELIQPWMTRWGLTI